MNLPNLEQDNEGLSWNYGAIAHEYVKNLEPMSFDVKVQELANLVKLFRHRAELDLLKRLLLTGHDATKQAQLGIKTARAELSFHNHIFLYEDTNS